MTPSVRRVVAASSVLVCLATVAVGAQRFRGNRSQRQDLGVEVQGNTPYDGRFVFVRLSYPTNMGRWVGDGGYPWSHDYPDGEVHFSKILEELTLLNIRTDGSNILSLDDPELFNYPIAYMAEPGLWYPSAHESESLRQYLLKGGFLIFDDFRGPHWDNLREQMQKVLPDHRWIELAGTATVFHSFFEIPEPLEMPAPYGGLPPSYWGIFEDNDPRKRLMAIANVNNDLSEYWEFSATGYYPVNLSNESYKFGVNYVIYGLTH